MPGNRARCATITSVRPSARYCLDGSPVKLRIGSTAIDGTAGAVTGGSFSSGATSTTKSPIVAAATAHQTPAWVRRIGSTAGSIATAESA
ncbi:MAG: hypothetical protein ABI039_07395, partial [Vicinamibacterales bacterium]